MSFIYHYSMDSSDRNRAYQWAQLSASIDSFACLFLFLSVDDFLSRYIFPQVPLRSFSISVKFFLSLLSTSFVSTVLTICGLIPAVPKHSSYSQKQLWLTSLEQHNFTLWLWISYVSFLFYFIDWKFDSFFFFFFLLYIISFFILLPLFFAVFLSLFY